MKNKKTSNLYDFKMLPGRIHHCPTKISSSQISLNISSYLIKPFYILLLRSETFIQRQYQIKILNFCLNVKVRIQYFVLIVKNLIS